MSSPPLQLPIVEYAPDQPSLIATGSSIVKNVYPRTKLSYGPIAAPQAVGNALNLRCQGATAFINNSTQVQLYAGDGNDLYTQINGVWTVVSQNPGGYNIDTTLKWEFEYFNDSVIATDFADAIQAVAFGSGAAFADLAGTPPKAKRMATVDNAFLMLGHTNDPINGEMEQRLWWSGAGDATNWPTPGGAVAAEFQSGAVDLLGPFGSIQALRTGIPFCDVAVFMQFGVKLGQYVGPNPVFDFFPAQGVNGTPAPYSPVVWGGRLFYLGWDGFYAWDGGAPLPIGAERIDSYFFKDLDLSVIYRVVGGVDPLNRLIWWIYPGQGHDGNNTPNRALIYNPILDRWSLVELTAETLCQLMGVGYTLDQLFTVLGYTLDNLPAPLDSPIWQGSGKPLFSLFDTSHKVNYLTGPNLAATVNTNEIQPIPGKRSRISGARPLVDGDHPTVSIGRRDTLQATVNYTPAIPVNSLGICPRESSGRYLQAQIATAAGDDWSHMSGVELINPGEAGDR